MRVVVDGSFSQYLAGAGLGDIFDDVFVKLCGLDSACRVTLLSSETAVNSFPKHPSISLQHFECDPTFMQSRYALWHGSTSDCPDEWRGVVVRSMHDIQPEKIRSFFGRETHFDIEQKQKARVRQADSLIVFSQSVKAGLVDVLGVSSESVHCVALSQNPLFRPADSDVIWRDNPPFLLYEGDRTRQQDFTNCLRALSSNDSPKELHLHVVGSPFSRQELSLIHALGISHRVQMLGPVTDALRCSLYNTAVALVLPATGVRFGLPLMEAMACGCPLIVAEALLSREIALDCPLYYSSNEPEELAALFTSVYGNLRQSERVRKGMKRASQFSRMRTAHELLEAYQKTLAANGRLHACAFPAGHYYSPVPDLEDVAKKRERLFRPKESVAGVDINEEGQLALWDRFLLFRKAFPFAAESGPLRYGLNNDFFGHGDAWSLYAMLRLFHPKRLVEVGSGHSSAAILDMNDLFLEGQLQTTFIDPYPERLSLLLREKDKKRARILASPVQEVHLDVFSQLSQDDVLFIDSSHVSKVGSDLNHLLFTVLPHLQSGVLIHFHDIFYPFEYPENWVFGGRFWNECYLMRAFLQHNTQYRIELFNSYLAHQHTEKVKSEIPFFLTRNRHAPWVEGCSSLWVRKL